MDRSTTNCIDLFWIFASIYGEYHDPTALLSASQFGVGARRSGRQAENSFYRR
jgi:hypothetical protein